MEQPIIDWDLAIKLAGNKKAFAEELLNLLIHTLPTELATLEQLYIDQNYDDLLRAVHKLHGAVAYSGLPRIKTVLSVLETELKNNIMDNLPSHMARLNAEINLLLEHYPRQ